MQKGTIQNSDIFLDNIAKSLGRERKETVIRPTWHHQPQWDVLANYTQNQLVDVLEAQCKSIHTDLIRTCKENLNETLLKVIKNFHGKTVMTSDDSRFEMFGLKDHFNEYKQREDIDVHTWDKTDGDTSIRVAERADVGITFSDITLAESGTVVLFSDEGKGRSVSLLPATYIALIPQSTLVPRMSQATKEIHRQVENRERVSSCVNFISGPSNSADIEMNLVVGVHGPIKATYIVIEDQ
ncbi:LutC/YkgG family protein [Aquibacillus rhizosphaerae]|uniref:Lactate utilization protein C n=1 Tax=Aquibacillus rhizosphaerae TaxID=3051431 RepID=A0ABT7L186_9BACI|nr:lactate utilization protein C [Aquibacillus sp. LR5S19]MDL4839596.1 lactate utilization protein C [Aquibacillus sp. LR5S19]